MKTILASPKHFASQQVDPQILEEELNRLHRRCLKQQQNIKSLEQELFVQLDSQQQKCKENT